MKSGAVMQPMFRPVINGFTWKQSWIYIVEKLLARHAGQSRLETDSESFTGFL